jgi:two-component system, NarL family, response regulator LiaR
MTGNKTKTITALSNKLNHIKVFLVDDHALVREGIKMYLKFDEHLEVIGEATNGEEALAKVASLKPDVVLMDLVMPIMDGVSAIAELKRQHPEVEIIALTSVLEDDKIFGAVQGGAIGYLLKDSKPQDLIDAVHAAGRGEVRLHPEVAKRFVKQIKTPDMREALTPRETDMLRLIGRGYSNKDICAEFGVSMHTVKTHVMILFDKIGVVSRTQAALFAIKHGLAGLE